MDYHEFLLFTGLAIIGAYWLPRFVSGREPAASALLIAAGLACALMLDDTPPLFSPIADPEWWEILSEMAVIVALFATGMRLDAISPFARWRATWPLLAGDVQVGPPTEGGEHPVRFALTTEAGLNDGLAFPFVYLALAVAAGFSAGDFLEWLAFDVVYRIFAGAAAGALAGWALGQVVFRWPGPNVLAETGSGVLAFAGVLLCYGLAEFIHAYGFIACFVGGVVFRRLEVEHSFHGNLHVFNLAIEHALTAVLLLMTGAALGTYAGWVSWEHVAIAASLVFVVRPLSGWLSLAGAGLAARERFVTAAFGVRGIGSLYYLAFAAGAAQVPVLADLWLTVLVTIALSALVHGLSAGAVLAGIRADSQYEPDPEAKPEAAKTTA